MIDKKKSRKPVDEKKLRKLLRDDLIAISQQKNINFSVMSMEELGKWVSMILEDSGE